MYKRQTVSFVTISNAISITERIPYMSISVIVNIVMPDFFIRSASFGSISLAPMITTFSGLTKDVYKRQGLRRLFAWNDPIYKLAGQGP